MDLVQPIAKTTSCPFKGEAGHWSLTIANRHIEATAWSYEDPFTEMQIIKNYFAFYPLVMDQCN